MPRNSNVTKNSLSILANASNSTLSTSLSALENHVKTINSTIPGQLPLTPFSLGLHQLSQYQRYAALSLDPRSQEHHRPTDLSQCKFVKQKSKESEEGKSAPSSPSLSDNENSGDGVASGEERSTTGSVSDQIDDSFVSDPCLTSGALDLTPKTSQSNSSQPQVSLSQVSNHSSSTSPNASPMALPVPAGMFGSHFSSLPFPSGRPNTTCQICFKTFACNSALEIHYRSHTKERPFKCNICDRGFSTKGNMKQHMMTHKCRDLPPQLYTTSLPSGSSGNNHHNSNSNQSPINSICGKESKEESGLGTHSSKQNINSNELSNQGVDDSKLNLSNSEMNDKKYNEESGQANSPSKKTSSNMSKHVCEECNKPFSSHSALQIHIRTHTGDRPFQCTICRRAFTTKGNLKVHMGTHIMNNGSSRRGRRMSIDLPNLHITPPRPGEAFLSTPYYPFLISQ